MVERNDFVFYVCILNESYLYSAILDIQLAIPFQMAKIKQNWIFIERLDLQKKKKQVILGILRKLLKFMYQHIAKA